MIYSAVRRQTIAGGRGTHAIRQSWVLSAAEISSAFTKKFSQIVPGTHRTRTADANGTQLAQLLERMIERVHGRDSFSDALERTLDMGVALPAIVRVEIVVATAPTSR
ncbi:MAG: hypothetical protein AUH76_04540 [Candidatus Rokubacteria bacterium 13_1_40CM_4_67_11]|nr:MAG: hypothetical protein AUH76_04540 [Candidatus Rokubacteria bacterium 13_1_40CM_4_67_11]